jgi:4-amino-4-deoxy-L-arabinose transferase-like glycosyltransferase
VLVAFLPWTPALLWALVTEIRALIRSDRLNAMSCFLLCWALFCVIFFTISRSKLPGYILPAVPAIALLLARAITKFGPARRWSFALTSLIPGLAMAAFFFLLFTHSDQILKKAVPYAPVVGFAVAAIGAANTLLALGFFLPRRNFAIFIAVMPVIFAMYMIDEALPFTPISTQSAHYLADQIRADEVPVNALRVANVKRAALYGLSFYLHTGLREWDGSPEREIYLLTQNPAGCDNLGANFTCEDVWQRPTGTDGIRLLHLTPNGR